MRDAAVQLLVESGVSGTTLAAIGLRSGYSRGLVTHRFGSKAGLLRYVLQTISERWRATLAQHTAGKCGAEALEGAVAAQLALLRESPEEVRAMFILWFVSIDPGSEFRANVRHVQAVQRRDVADWIVAGQERGCVARSIAPERAAEQFCAGMIGIVYQWLVDPDVPLAAMHEELQLRIRDRYAIGPDTPRGSADARRLHI